MENKLFFHYAFVRLSIGERELRSEKEEILKEAAGKKKEQVLPLSFRNLIIDLNLQIIEKCLVVTENMLLGHASSLEAENETRRILEKALKKL